MKLRLKLLITAASLLTAFAMPAMAQERYRQRPPVVVSPDLSAPWVMQLGQRPVSRQRSYSISPPPRVKQYAPARITSPKLQRKVVRGRDGKLYYAAAPRAVPKPAQIRPQMDPIYLPRDVAYDSDLKPGSIVVDTQAKFLYLIQGNGQARRYGVGVGKDGMTWSGTETVSNKRVWPSWHPPQEMRERELREKGRVLPAMMPGGEANPLGARALYLGDTLYRIHGTNAPWTIGTNNSSGCIRMRNQDVIELYEQVGVGAKVVVL